MSGSKPQSVQDDFAVVRLALAQERHVPHGQGGFTAEQALQRIEEQLAIEEQERADFEASQARLLEQKETLLEAIAEAMTSLATGPLKDDYAYSVLEEACERIEPNPNPASEPKEGA